MAEDAEIPEFELPLAERVARWRRKRDHPRTKSGRKERPQRRNSHKRKRRRQPSFTKRLKALGHSSYDAYLVSDHWKEVKERQPKTPCLGCGIEKRLQLHHMTYERLGEELSTDLIWLCGGCHTQLHKHGKKSFPKKAAVRSATP